MKTYRVHVYRELRLYFPAIEASSAEEAAQLAAGMPTAEAEQIHDCEGETLCALVDVPGDEDYRHSVQVDFDLERLRNAGPALWKACRLLDQACREGDGSIFRETLHEAWQLARTALAQAPALDNPADEKGEAMDLPQDHGLTPLDLPVPPELAETWGYPGEARFVAFLCEGGANDVVFTDGLMFGSGDGPAFAAFSTHQAVLPRLAPYDLGLSGAEAKHCLVLDRDENRLWVADKYAARAFLKRQHPPPASGPPPELTPDAFTVSTDRHAVHEAKPQDWAIARMLTFLDQHS